MEQLNYLLGYVGVFLWAFGICQVKVTKDKKRWLLSGILGIGAISMIFLYPKIYALYWLALLLIFLLFMCLVSENWKRKCVIYLFSMFYIDIIVNPIRTIIIATEVLKNENWQDKNVIWSIIEILCILVASYFISKHEKIKKWIKELPTGYYFVRFFVFFYIYRNIFLFGNTNGRILYQGTSYSKYFSNICNRNALYPMYCSGCYCNFL